MQQLSSAARETFAAPKAKTSKQAIVVWLVSFAICAVMSDGMVPARHALPVRIAADLFCAGLFCTFPLLVMKLWEAGPGVFARWLFWSAVLIAPSICAGVLYLNR